jgi:hypothetical protein
MVAHAQQHPHRDRLRMFVLHSAFVTVLETMPKWGRAARARRQTSAAHTVFSHIGTWGVIAVVQQFLALQIGQVQSPAV